MDYFELFGLPLGFEVERAALTQAYYRLSKQYHPDNFTLAKKEQQDEALAMTAEINRGYKILKSQPLRLRYVLEKLGISFEEGKEAMPQEFLMEMMDLNEAIMDYKMDPSLEVRAEIEKQVSAFESGLGEQLRLDKESLDLNAPDAEILQSMKACYLKSKYLKRLLDNLDDRGVEL